MTPRGCGSRHREAEHKCASACQGALRKRERDKEIETERERERENPKEAPARKWASFKHMPKLEV